MNFANGLILDLKLQNYYLLRISHNPHFAMFPVFIVLISSICRKGSI